MDNNEVKDCQKENIHNLYNENLESLNNSNQDEFKNCEKRKDYLSWSDYFMSIAILSAQRSKDPCTQVGACIVNEQNKIVSIGYNGMPSNCSDDIMPWGKNNEDKLKNKHLYVCHAELNAVLNNDSKPLKNCTIYTTLFPCNECAKIIIQSGIKKVYYLLSKEYDNVKYSASKFMFRMANIEFKQYQPQKKTIILDLYKN